MIKKKICVISTSLGQGGAERSSALLTKILYDLGYDVCVIITKNIIEYSYYGKLFNLELEVNKGNALTKTIILKKYLNKNKFDYVIDNRTRNSLFKETIFYKYLLRGIKTIAVVRSAHLEYYIPKRPYFGRFLYNNILKVVTVSEDIKNKLESHYQLKNVCRIYNPIDSQFFKNIAFKKLDQVTGKYILFYGRIEESIKNISLLLDGYKNSRLIESEVKLVILGDGPDVLDVKQKVKHLGMENYIHFIPFTSNPFLYVKNALYTVLTSYFEGFPRVLVESLAIGTPVISVDCKSGPSEIITDRFNGLLIENFNIKALSNAMNMFIEDEELYLFCKKNTLESVEHLDINNITLEWKQLFN